MYKIHVIMRCCVLYNSLLWKPAPAKLSLFPSTVKSHLFPQYHGLSTGHSTGQGRVTIKLPPEMDSDAVHGAKKSGKTGSAFTTYTNTVMP